MFKTDDPRRCVGQPVGNGQCVALVRQEAGAPHTGQWRRGARVRGHKIKPGTAIATFSDDTGQYENDTEGASHCALYLSQSAEGIRVVDQWAGKKAGERLIGFRGGAGKKADDGDQYFVVVTYAEL
jgi:hypothetical protein